MSIGGVMMIIVLTVSLTVFAAGAVYENMFTKEKPASGNDGYGQGNGGRQMKRTTLTAGLSRRISIGKLEDIYQMRHGHKRVNELEISIDEIHDVPDSFDMTFGDWLDYCKSRLDIYEEAV